MIRSDCHHYRVLHSKPTLETRGYAIDSVFSPLSLTVVVYFMLHCCCRGQERITIFVFLGRDLLTNTVEYTRRTASGEQKHEFQPGTKKPEGAVFTVNTLTVVNGAPGPSRRGAYHLHATPLSQYVDPARESNSSDSPVAFPPFLQLSLHMFTVDLRLQRTISKYTTCKEIFTHVLDVLVPVTGVQLEPLGVKIPHNLSVNTTPCSRVFTIGTRVCIFPAQQHDLVAPPPPTVAMFVPMDDTRSMVSQLRMHKINTYFCCVVY